MKSLVLSGLVVLFAPLSYAGTYQAQGVAHVGHDADFMEVSVTVRANCFDSSEIVLTAAQKTSEMVQGAMKSYKLGERDELKTYPGRTVRRSVTQYDSETGKNTVVCANKWSVENRLVLKVADLNVWTNLQDALFQVDTNMKSLYERPDAQPKIDVVLEAPEPRLYPETLKAVKEQADQLALSNAQADFNRVAGQCGLVQLGITEIRRMAEPRAIAYAAAAAESTRGANDAEFNPDFAQLWVHSELSVTYNYHDRGQAKGCLLP